VNIEGSIDGTTWYVIAGVTAGGIYPFACPPNVRVSIPAISGATVNVYLVGPR